MGLLFGKSCSKKHQFSEYPFINLLIQQEKYTFLEGNFLILCLTVATCLKPILLLICFQGNYQKLTMR